MKAFTLTEVVIAVFIALLLMIGIHRVFSTTAMTIGAGNALTEANRSHKAAFSTMQIDIQGTGDGTGIVPADEAPFLVIDSRERVGYRDPRALEAGESSTHRIDLFSFFARGDFPRQTANMGNFTADMVGDEAWIVYGHLKLGEAPDRADWTTASYHHPGEFDPVQNGNNYFVRDWTLGRMAVLLMDPDSPDMAGQHYVNSDPPPFVSADESLAPLHESSRSTDMTINRPTIQSARYDVAGTRMAMFRPRVSDVAAVNPLWGRSVAYRFQANPFPPRGYDSSDMARLSPILLRHCSDFLVEFAGDYDPESPGHIDMVTDANGQTGIRWYGFPRPDAGVDTVAAAHGQQPFEQVLPGNVYRVAWGPAELDAGLGPQMIRLTVRVIDPRNRLQEGLAQEYVFRLR